ncbi:MAG: hypothetical protein U0N13_18615 [Parabacteroides johnsonii]
MDRYTESGSQVRSVGTICAFVFVCSGWHKVHVAERGCGDESAQNAKIPYPDITKHGNVHC